MTQSIMMNYMNSVCEYIWIGGNGELRSKTRVLDKNFGLSPNNYPLWNYDGSSTNQVNDNTNHNNTEVILKPVKIYCNPLVDMNFFSSLYNRHFYYLVFCETYDIDNTPLPTNTRYTAKLIFDKKNEEEPWYGLEQEYFMRLPIKYANSYTLSENDYEKESLLSANGEYYCGTSLGNIQRTIVEQHLNACLYCGLKISGINAEVSPQQWEFQVGPCVGINSGDELYMARFLLERIAEKYDVGISYDPKPCADINGSGCHTNFSTYKMRDVNGINEIYRCIKKMDNKHNEHIKIYGLNNHKRLTGIHETSSSDNFSFGVGTRHTSIRIPNQVEKDKRGYFEDRRPGSNIDPYLVTSKIFDTCCL